MKGINSKSKNILVKLYDDIKKELERAEAKWPVWPTNIYESLAIITEEVGELNQAVLQHEHEKGPLENIRKEAIQVGAMALRFLKNLEYIEI